ncbi:copper resistance D family protein [Paenibacillus soyae]|uniref:CopD family protein n=1 Tax=Paenibacillus soyae TaxID=2969249 RepID=A0A9X2S6N7_9BACL|nr:CopD family protein [Paenibacillus soyae]MCR2802429.1 CopD family protein [Paenibacillus soyae]
MVQQIVNRRALALFLLLAVATLFIGMDASAQTGEMNAAFAAHEHASTGTGQEAVKDTIKNALLIAVKIAYYVMLLLTAGAALLQGLVQGGEQGEGQKALLRKWNGSFVKGLIVAVILYVFIHSNHMVSELRGGGKEWLRLFAETSSGQTWLALILLSAIGFAVIRLNDGMKTIWAVLLLAAESFGGHVSAVHQSAAAIVFDFIHLVSAAVWAGGVMILLLFWRADRKEAGRFAEKFAGIAWMTIAALAASGIVMTCFLIPTPLYLIYTGWGKLLLAKAALVLLVIALGASLRARAKRRELPRGLMLKLDGLLMAVIIVIAGILTSVSPVPGGEPFNQHQMGEELHFTLNLSPNAPGPNEVALSLWLPEDSGKPQAVSLVIVSADNPEQAAIVVPLAPVKLEEGFAFPGFLAYTFGAEDVKLPRPGEWTAKLEITEADGTKLARDIAFSN